MQLHSIIKPRLVFLGSTCIYFDPIFCLTEPLTDVLLHRIPAVEKAEIRQMINGPESSTPDGRAVLGEAPGVNSCQCWAVNITCYLCVNFQIKNYFVAAGMNSTGIASAGGFGRALAEWIADGD